MFPSRFSPIQPVVDSSQPNYRQSTVPADVWLRLSTETLLWQPLLFLEQFAPAPVVPSCIASCQREIALQDCPLIWARSLPVVQRHADNDLVCRVSSQAYRR